MRDTRTESRRALGLGGFRPDRASLLTVACVVVGFAAAYLPAFSGMPPAPRVTLQILVTATLLWVTEAMPPFAVGVLAMAAEIALLGRPGGVFAREPGEWEMFVRPWGSPVVWLFLGGLVLASAATKTRLDQEVAAAVLRRVSRGPRSLLFACMGITFVFSMFVSNTASTSMMMAVIAPLLRGRPERDRFSRALCVAIPLGASVGGMGTPIGSPPNAVVIGLLGAAAPTFATWMLLAVPPAIVLVLVCGWVLGQSVRGCELRIDWSGMRQDRASTDGVAPWQRALVVAVFVLTVGLWLTTGLHGVPVAVVSFVPLAVLTTARVIEPDDIRQLPWDVLLLLAGGMSLGVAVQETGLAAWLIDNLAPQSVSPLALTLALGAVACLLSNVMSNTAATNVLAPIAIAMVGGGSVAPLVSLALCASLATALPASTPPNAIAFASGRLQSRDFLRTGAIVAVVGVPVAVLWCWTAVGSLP
jgi:solute carrier family 13 (sodium-dependent dicarboxylate transporter), member 2/3/5